MSEPTPHRAFVRFTVGIALATAVVAGGTTALRRGPPLDPSIPLAGSAADRALDNLRRHLLEAHGLAVVVEDGRAAIAWNDGFALERHGLLDYLRSHPFTFAATRGATLAPDVYRATARVSASGMPIEVGDVVNLTRTAHGEERQLAVAGPFVAFVNRIDGLARQVVLLDYRGEIPSTVADYGLLDRLMNAVANWQSVGDARGVGRRTYEFARTPGQAALRFEGDPLRLVVDTGGPPAAIDPRTGEVSGEGSASLVAVPPTPKARRMFVDWIANTLRRFIGEKRFEWVKVYALSLQDKLRRFRNALLGAAAPDAEEMEEGRIVAAQGPGKRLPVRFGQDPNWPPPPVEPIVRSPPLRGEGQWVDIYDFDLRNPGAPPALLKTVIRPDPQRLHAAVRIVLADPRQVDLHIVAGTKHPESTTGHQGDGLIPRDRETLTRLLAAFNGGFKTMHGASGMMVRGKVIVPPQKNFATVATLRDGRTAIGTWALPRDAPLPGVLSYRQNLPPLVANGVFNPMGVKKWGNVVDELEGTHTYRSGLGVTRAGHLLYAWGDDLTAETLAHAMIRAGVVYALHLDMNHGHSRFEFYRVYDESTIARRRPDRRLYQEGSLRYQAKKLSSAQVSWLFPRYLKPDIRDFFYLTLRRVFPFEDPQAPAWSVAELPEEFREFPPLLVRARVRVADEDVAVFKVDALRARLRLRLGGAEATTAPAGATQIALDDMPRLAGVIAGGTPDEGLRPPGTWIEGQEIVPPTRGAMTVVLDREGRLRIERWTGDARDAWSARQGLALVEEGKPCEEARAATRSRSILRGALGVDRRGDILYAVANTAWPLSLAEALAEAGAVRALALGPGTRDAFFHLYTPGEAEGQVVATDLASGSRRILPAAALGQDQTFLYITAVPPAPRIVPLDSVLAVERTAQRH